MAEAVRGRNVAAVRVAVLEYVDRAGPVAGLDDEGIVYITCVIAFSTSAPVACRISVYCYFCREDEAPLICNRGGFAAVADTTVIIIARRRVAQLY